MFIAIDTASQRTGPIRSTLGVIGMLRFADQMPAVSEAVIANLQRNTDPETGLIRPPQVCFEAGDKIVVATGCSGTLFHASKLPLTKWFQAMYLITQNKNNIFALSLKGHLGVAYTTAWRVKHKLLEAMRQRESRRLLNGLVFADDALLGGVHAGKPGRGSQNKTPFMAAVELDGDGHPRHVHFDPIADDKRTTFADWAKSALHPSAHLVTDGCACFNAAGAEVAAHGAIIVGQHNSSDLAPFRWVNTFISKAKTAIAGTYHHFDFAKYRHRYLAEAQYRVNHRFDLASLVRRLTHTCVRTDPCPERWLRLAEVSGS